MPRVYLIVLVFLAACSQKKEKAGSYENQLRQEVAGAGSDETKIAALGRLSWYFMDIDRVIADSITGSSYSIAENSKAYPRTLIQAYLFDAQRHLQLYDRKSEMEAVYTLADKAMNLANSGNEPDYAAYAYIYMAHSRRALGNMDAARELLSKAYNLVNNSKSDSLKVEFYYLRSQLLQDTRELNQALDDATQVQQVAEKSDNDNLRVLAYWRLGVLYEDIDSLQAKDYYRKLSEACDRISNDEQKIGAYLLVGRFFAAQHEIATEGLKYLRKGMELATQLDHRNLVMQSHLALTRYFIATKQPDSASAYLEKYLPDIIAYYRQNGEGARLLYTYGTFYYNLGKYYRSDSKPVEANNCFREALLQFAQSDSAYSNDVVNSRKSDLNFYHGACNYYLYFLNKKNVSADWYMSAEDSAKAARVSGYYTNSTYYFMQTQDQARAMNDPEFMRNVFSWMEDLFEDSAYYYDNVRKNNLFTLHTPRVDYYKMSFAARQLYDSCDNAFRQLTNQKDKIRIEALAKERLDDIAKEKKRHQENIKQMIITLALAGLFLLLVLLGFLKVSEYTIKALSFFAFLFLFEFIIMLADEKVHSWTHGEMISSLLVKIGIAAIIVPVHHKLETGMIRFLTRRHLLRKKPGDTPAGNGSV